MNHPQEFGPYKVEGEVGRGGMGVVYRARDPRLDRVVAIKVLPAELAQDPERLARFEREARLLASLNHPNIGSIYGLEQAEDGTRFLVLEFLEGPTLQDRLARGPLPLEEALEVFQQIAAALEAAHESGIIHRDLKPANIKLTPDGGVKVLDFGLAKDTAPDAGSGADLAHSPTIPAQTMAGVILGTAAYMSPEQARGKPLDRRTDIFSFGCVLFESLTGRSLFAGETVSDTIARILEREPEWSALSADIPERIRRILQRCLEKDSRKRRRDIGDVRLALEEIREARASSLRAVRESGEYQAAPAPSRRSAALAWTIAAVATLAAAASFLLPAFRDAPAPGQLVRFTVAPPAGGTFDSWSGFIKISPDGSALLAAGQDADGAAGAWVRDLDNLESRFLPQMRGSQFWSPDGESIGFFAGERIRAISRRGGETRIVCDAVSDRGGAWGKDFIVFALAQGPLYKVPAGGGTPEPVTVLDESLGETAHRYPHFLPDGETFLYVALPGKSRLLTVYAGHVDGRAPTAITTSLTSPVYTDPEYLLFQRGRKIVAQAFDPRKLTVSGDLIVVDSAPELAEGVGTPALSASRSGHLAFLTPEDPRTRLVWLDGTTGEELETPDVEPDVYDAPRLSPDGRHVALVVEASPEESDIWTLELDRLVMTRFTQGPGRKADPIWSPDGAYLAYSTDAAGPSDIYMKPFTTGGPAEPLVVGPAPFKNPLDWSPDGKFLMYEQLGDGTNMDLWIAPTDGSGEPRPYLAEVYQEREARFSPDGRWVTYTGSDNVLVNSFPVPGQAHQVSIDGGGAPYWDGDGSGIRFFYLTPNGPVHARATFRTEPRLRTGIPEELFLVAPDLRGGGPTADGRILALRAVVAAREATGTVILNWTRMLESEIR